LAPALLMARASGEAFDIQVFVFRAAIPVSATRLH
jgi:hypothetical protein